MPDLGNLLNPSSSCSSSPSHSHNLEPATTTTTTTDQFDQGNGTGTSLYPVPIKTVGLEGDWGFSFDQKLRLPVACKADVGNGSGNGNGNGVLKRCRGGGAKKLSLETKSLDEYVKEWVDKKIAMGFPKSKCSLPFLVGAPKLVDCVICQNFIYPGEEVLCAVRNCKGVYHLSCATERLGFLPSKPFKCPQHACFLCKQRIHLWRCTRCHIALHEKCAAFPEHVIYFHDQPGQAVCWRHPSDWHLEKEIFHRLPVPYVEEEFKIDITWKDMMENKLEPPPYVHIKRNIYLTKKQLDDTNADIGCTNCSSTCNDNCVCRVQCVSCSKACRCRENCTNRPFRKEKKIKIVKTELCGWGVVAAESINEGDFIIEYIGEVINDASCTQRLWDMKYSGVKNFYMCEIRKNFTIDATFKGNSARFLNHSCDPNCKLEKWQVDGETRVGVFAARSIEVGEPLTYDYRFVQFGPEVKCHCGASNCQGFLGTKRKIGNLEVCWGSKKKRTTTACVAIVKL